MNSPLTVANRPTVERLAGLFDKWGIVPDPARFFGIDHTTGRPRGCLIMAMLTEVTGSIQVGSSATVSPHSPTRTVADLMGVPIDYVAGLLWGFIAAVTVNPYVGLHTPIEIGWEDGHAVRDLVLTLQPEKP